MGQGGLFVVEFGNDKLQRQRQGHRPDETSVNLVNDLKLANIVEQ